MSAYYDLFEKPDVRQTGEQQSLYARFVPKAPSTARNLSSVYIFSPASAAACWKERWQALWTSCATALPMAGRWSWANWVTSPPL